MTAPAVTVSRRAVIQGTGALLLSFVIPATRSREVASARHADAALDLPGSLAKNPLLDAWIRIDADGSVTAFTGKAELGQGIRTALLQVIAEELDVPWSRLTLVTADTERTPNEGYTAGSHSVQDSGTALRHAAAQVRGILLAEAARHLSVPEQQLHTEAGAVLGPNGDRVSYGELVASISLHVQAQPSSQLKDPARYSVMNHPVPRVDIPGKVSGAVAYVQDLRPPGMLHARVVRPPGYRAALLEVNVNEVESMPGVMKVVRNGSFLAVIAQREFQAIQAMWSLAREARWSAGAALPDGSDIRQLLLGLPTRDETILDTQPNPARPSNHGLLTLEASYSRPYIAHASIGPSCALAQFTSGVLTVWSHTQGVYPDRQAIAEMLHLPSDKVRCIHVEGSGCYGHNGADDAAADAALLAFAIPDRPIRVQWMREQEHAWEPYGPAMLAQVRGALDTSGRIASWDYGIWSNTHSMRPGPAGALLAAQHLEPAFPIPEPRPIPQPEGGGDRNAIPLYSLPQARVVHHFLPDMPVRISALRSLGAHMNVFAIESFMDELAVAARADPVEFRLRHLEDPRARDIVSAAADEFRWSAGSAPGQGRGFAFARYKNLAAYCAVAMQVEVSPETGRIHVRRAIAAVDAGEVINPDGLRNQIEGAILQSLSWTLFEQVRFDRAHITSIDWASYPILRFGSVPESVSVRIVERPGTPFLGCGEAGQGPAAAALANAVADATGKRFRELPLSPARIKAALAS
ncbi:MAG TPA: molybdopterin cofactor-binding domain-containing protein [Steroidobacteraceae bacterium]|nr:molybdopterin cofactor-binding domain-containing protein [Steroidobacteraceae bacterium]